MFKLYYLILRCLPIPLCQEIILKPEKCNNKVWGNFHSWKEFTTTSGNKRQGSFQFTSNLTSTSIQPLVNCVLMVKELFLSQLYSKSLATAATDVTKRKRRNKAGGGENAYIICSNTSTTAIGTKTENRFVHQIQSWWLVCWVSHSHSPRLRFDLWAGHYFSPCIIVVSIFQA